MSSFRATISTAAVIAFGLAAAGAIPPASAEPLMWWELGVTPSYGYGDDYPQRPVAVREAHPRWGYRPVAGHAGHKARL